MKKYLWSMLGVLLIVALVATSAAATTYTLQKLASNAEAWGMNSSGQVVGASNGSAYMWELGQAAVTLGTGTAYGINDSGLVVGSIGTDAWYWMADGSGNNKLFSVGGYSASCKAYGVNSDGDVVGYSRSTVNGYRGSLWTNTANNAENLDTYGFWSNCQARGINDNGDIAGYYDNGAAHSAVLWSNYGETWYDLGLGDAYAVNIAGRAVGVNGPNAHVWYEDGNDSDLGLGQALGINSDGYIVGCARFEANAYLWSPDESLTILPSLGGNKTVARAINDNGWITGYSIDADGVKWAVVWTPEVPEPSCLAALAAGLGCFCIRRRK